LGLVLAAPPPVASALQGNLNVANGRRLYK